MVCANEKGYDKYTAWNSQRIHFLKEKHNQNVHFILKFALHSYKIERTKLGFLEKKLQKSPEKIFSLCFGQRHWRDAVYSENNFFFLLQLFIFVCGSVVNVWCIIVGVHALLCGNQKTDCRNNFSFPNVGHVDRSEALSIGSNHLYLLNQSQNIIKYIFSKCNW